MKKELQRLIDILEVKVYELGPFDISYYDEENNAIHIANNPKAMLEFSGRPTYRNFSIAHELAHAIAANYDLEGFEEVFGEYPEEYDVYAIYKSLTLTRSDYYPTYLTAYASFHPEEDFADCVGFYLTAPRRDWDKKTPSIRKKMEYVKKVLKEVLEGD